MAGEDQPSTSGPASWPAAAEGQVPGGELSPVDPVAPTLTGSDASDVAGLFPSQSPLFHAEHADRYERQQLIAAYEDKYNCRLVVLIDQLFADCILLFEELIHDADPSQDLHVILDSPGGDGETALRLAHSAHARCDNLVIIVPDQAKSAATMLAMAATKILMGPTSDLGPIDPQMRLDREGGFDFVACKDILAAVDRAETAIDLNPNVYPLHATLLASITAFQVEQARAAIDRTDELAEEILMCPGRTEGEAKALWDELRGPLRDEPKNHAAVVHTQRAIDIGLPVESLPHLDTQWRLVWLLYTKYKWLSRGLFMRAYEGRRSSRIIIPPQQME